MTGVRPRVSVVMPVFNAGRLLRPTLESILGQTLVDFELIAVDDGSTDGSGEVLDAYSERDPRVKVIHQGNCGVSRARNAGIVASSADLVAVSDSDDLSHPARLELQAEMLDAMPHLAAVGCGIRVVDPDGRVLRLDPIPRWDEAPIVRFVDRFDVAGPTIMVRRNVLETVGRYRPPFRAADDYDCIARMIDAGFALDNVPERLYDYVIHPHSVTHSSGAAQRLEVVASDLSREIRGRGFVDPFDQVGALTDLASSEQDLPADLGVRLKAIASIASHLERAGRLAGSDQGLDPGSRPALGHLRREMGRRAWRSDILVGIHRARYHEARAEREWIAALAAGLDLWFARRKPRTSRDDLFLPRRRTT